MANLFPVLIFTRGAQKGRRIELTRTMNVVGRDRTCDVEIIDEYASRQHARIIVEGPRVRLVNTSPNGTRVNGKPIEQAVLQHGDVINFGLECEARIETPEGAAKPAAPGEDTSRRQDAQSQTAAQDSAEAVKAEVAGRLKAKKKPSMLIWVSVYVVGLTTLFILLSLLRDERAGAIATGGALSDDDIRQIIDQPLTNIPLNARLAKKHLDDASRGYDLWRNGLVRPDHLYRVVYNYKLALAYQGKTLFEGADTLHNTRMDEAKDGLFKEVRVYYKTAYIYQRQGRWARAFESYHAMLKQFPNDAKQDELYKHVLEQLNVVNHKLNEASRRGRYASR